MNATGLFGQAFLAGSVAHWIIVLIVVAAVVAIGLVALRAAGVVVPPWVQQIGLILLVAFVAVLAIRFLLSAV